jgi:hypothetical protein
MENKEEAIGFHSKVYGASHCYLFPALSLPRMLYSQSASSHGAVNVT